MAGGDIRVLGVDVGGSSVKMGMLDAAAGIVEVSKTDTLVGDPEGMADLISGLAAGYKPDIVGVGTAGAVNYKTGLVSASNLGWRGVNLRHMLEERIGRPVWVDNDAQAALMAETHNGALVGARCAVYITLGTGVGGALLLDGRPWRGDDNTAFELGHIITRADGEQCVCGKYGCLERYASRSALSRYAGGKAPRAVLDGILAREPADLKAFDIYLHELSIGIISIFSLFRPEVIAIGGGVSVAGEALIEGVYRELESLLSGRRGLDAINIRLAVHKTNAGMIGAAALAKMRLG